jgi:DNA polymerase
VDERRRRAWAALGIGPAWMLRDPAVGDPLTDAAVDPAERGEQAETVDTAESPVPLVPVEAAEAPPAPIPERRPDASPVLVVRSRAPSAQRDPVIAGLDWAGLAEAVSGCEACGLCAGRRNTVFGTGPRPAAWMLVGEAPGQQEDLSGEPFVGDAGRLLDEMLRAIGVDRAGEAFIANVMKCRPPGNRDPVPDEIARCEPYLLRQVELLQPRLIVVLGRFAAQSLLRTDATVASLRGRVHAYRAGGREVPMVVTYHPAYLLRNLPEKAKVWADLRLARRTFDALG